MHTIDLAAIRLLLPLLGATLLAGCAAAVRPSLAGAAAECYALFEDADARVRAAGAGEASLHRVAGFPYLRTTRLLASFRDEVDAPARFAAWVAEMRARDQQARAAEILVAAGKLEWEPPERELQSRLAACGETLVDIDLADPARRALLRRAAAVPDDYSVAQRLFGAYPLSALLLKLGIRGYQAGVRADFAAAPQVPAGARLLLWRLRAGAAAPATPAETARWLARTQHPLGIPQLEDAEIERLLAAHAPAWWIEQASDADLPGSPHFDRGEPRVDISQARTYALLDYARAGGAVLPQLVYIVWFAERPHAGALDPYAGRLDGVVWRVTLAPDGAPLVYDTIHACGCYHHFFPARALEPRAQDDFWQESVLLPQGQVGAGPLAIRLAAGTHYVRRVVPLAEAAHDEAGMYTIAPYGELGLLPAADRRPRSLFRAGDGLVRGSERLERLWLWPSGERSPGAMRAWGRHATAFVGRRHFDDPYLIERLFVVPGSVPR